MPYKDTALTEHIIKFYRLRERHKTELLDERFANVDFDLRNCSKCHLIYQRFAPDPILAREIYAEWIDGDGDQPPDRKVQIENYNRVVMEARALVTMLLRHQGKTSPQELKVLDFGTGWARFALAMKAYGCDVYVQDLSPARLANASANGLKTIDAEDIPGARFDYINTEQVVEHLPDPRAAVRQLSEGLGRRGVLKVSVPYAAWLERGPVRIDWSTKEGGRYGPKPIEPLQHLNYFRSPSLLVLAQRLGLRELKLSKSDDALAALGMKGLRGVIKRLMRIAARQTYRHYHLFTPTDKAIST